MPHARTKPAKIDWTGRISKCGDKMLRSYLYEAANVLLTRVAKWSVLKAWASGWRSEAGFARPRLPSPESLPSSCTGCGLTAPSSTGQRRRLPLRTHNRIIEITEVPRTSGRRRPCRDDSGGEVAPGFAMPKSANALHTLIHQRHPTPLCGGQAPTAERTLDPARMFTERLTPGPELENGARVGPRRTFPINEWPLS